MNIFQNRVSCGPILVSSYQLVIDIKSIRANGRYCVRAI